MQTLSYICIILCLSACGRNIASSYISTNPSEEAAKALEDKDPKKAVSIILDELGKDFKALYLAIPTELAKDNDALPTNQVNTEAHLTAMSAEVSSLKSAKKVKDIDQLVSILSSAYATIYKIDSFDLALALANTSPNNNASPITLLFPVLPEATNANINGVKGANLILDSIGSSNFTTADYFKKSLFLTASVSLTFKQLDTNGNQEIDPEELLNIDGDFSDKILSLLLQAGSSVSNSGTEESDEKASVISEKISAIHAEILSSDGGDDSAKIQSYISSN